jgi:hypothetical protein
MMMCDREAGLLLSDRFVGVRTLDLQGGQAAMRVGSPRNSGAS